MPRRGVVREFELRKPGADRMGLTAVLAPELHAWRAQHQHKHGNRKSGRSRVRLVMGNHRLIAALTQQAHNEIDHRVNPADTWLNGGDQNARSRTLAVDQMTNSSLAFCDIRQAAGAGFELWIGSKPNCPGRAQSQRRDQCDAGSFRVGLRKVALFSSHLAIGVPKPVLLRIRWRSHKGAARLDPNISLPDATAVPHMMGATFRNSSVSTSGTRTSSECAMLAQSVSRNS